MTSGAPNVDRKRKAVDDLSGKTIEEIVEQANPHFRLDPGVESLLNELSQEFITTVTRHACQLAIHRWELTRTTPEDPIALTRADLLLPLQRIFGLTLPQTFIGAPDPRQLVVPCPIPAVPGRSTYREKLAAVSKAQAAREQKESLS